jgi:hypothetical protein
LHREKRQTGAQINFPNDKSVCTLYLRIDPFLYQTIFNNEGNKNDKTTQSFLIYYLIQQVNALNTIYGSTKFFADSTRYYTGLSFKITRIKVILP